MELNDFDAVLLDLDGTLYHEDHALPGAAKLIAHLSAKAIPFACLSNSTQDAAFIIKRLVPMGIDIDPDRIYTAAEASADYVLERFGPRPRVYTLATEGLTNTLQGRCHWVESIEEACDAVIVGVPASVYATEERRRVGVALLRAGALCVGMCADRVYPSQRGLEIGSGALTMMMSYAANVTPVFCGKPQPIFFHELCRQLSVAPSRCVLIGDNLESDIAGAKGVGMATILTLTGVVRQRDVAGIPPALKPDRIITTLEELF